MNKRALASGLFLLLGCLAIPATSRAALPPIPLPPPLLLPVPPPVVILPDTDVYVAADLADDLFFSAGWWWRPWHGRWYRSRSYDRGWVHYRGTPHFYRTVPRDWRDDYRARRWGGGAWDYQLIPQARLKRNWSHWQSSGYWRSPEHRQHHYHHDGRPIEAHRRRDVRERRVEKRDHRVEKKERNAERKERRAEKKERRAEKKERQHDSRARRRDR